MSADFTCSSGPQCISQPPTIVADHQLCLGCREELARKIAELPFLAQGLRAHKGGIQGAGLEGRVSGSAEPASPLNLVVVDLIGECLEVAQLDVKADNAAEIRRVHKKASDQVGLHEKWMPRGMPCPRCVSREFGGFIGTERLSCKECGFTISTDKWHGLCAEVLRAERCG